MIWSAVVELLVELLALVSVSSPETEAAARRGWWFLNLESLYLR